MIININFSEEAETMTDEQAVRLRVQELCRERGITIRDLGVRCNVDSEILSRIEEGTNLNTPLSEIKEICDALEMTLADFFVNDLFYGTELSG